MGEGREGRVDSMAEQSRQEGKLDLNEAAKELKGSACDLATSGRHVSCCSGKKEMPFAKRKWAYNNSSTPRESKCVIVLRRWRRNGVTIPGHVSH